MTSSAASTLRVGRHDVRVNVAQRGSGRPLLLLNGIGASAELFEPFLAHVTDRETIAPDVPGAGSSPPPGYPPTLRRVARVVADVVAELGHERVDVLGLSWGGALAQELAHRHPGLVRRLVLAATTPGWVSLPGHPAAMAILLSPARYYSPAYLRAVAPTLYGGAIAQHPEVLERHAYLRSTHAPSPRGYLYQLCALRRWSSLPWLHRLPQPTLVLAADDDPIIPLANARLMARRIPAGRLHVVEGGGHLFLFTHGREVAELIRRFLDR